MHTRFFENPLARWLIFFFFFFFVAREVSVIVFVLRCLFGFSNKIVFLHKDGYKFDINLFLSRQASNLTQ